MPVAQTIADSITDRLNRLTQRQNLSVFETVSLRKDIDQLKLVDAKQAFMLGGMLSSLVDDVAGSEDFHEKSLRLGGGVIEYVNYAISMQRLGRASRAVELFLEAFKLEPTVDVFSRCVKSMNFSGDYRELESVVSRTARANPQYDINRNVELVTARSVAEHLASISLTKDQYRLVLRHVESIGFDIKLRIVEVRERLGSFDEVPHVYVAIGCRPASAAVLAEANDRLVNAIIEDEELTDCWHKIIASFTCALNVDLSKVVT